MPFPHTLTPICGPDSENEVFNYKSSHCILKQTSNLSQLITRLHELENSVKFQ